MQSKNFRRGIGIILLTLSFGGNLNVYGMDRVNYPQRLVKLRLDQTRLSAAEKEEDFWTLANSMQRSLDLLIDFFGGKSVLFKNKSLCVDTNQEGLDSLRKQKTELLELYHLHDKIKNELTLELKRLAKSIKSTPKTTSIKDALQRIEKKLEKSCDIRQTLEGDFCAYCELLNYDEKSLYNPAEIEYVKNFVDDVRSKTEYANNLIFMCRQKGIVIKESINNWREDKKRLVNVLDAHIKGIPFDELVRCTQSLVDSVNALKKVLYNSETYNSYAARLNDIEVVNSLACRIRDEYSRVMSERSYFFKEKSDYNYNLCFGEFLYEHFYQIDKNYMSFSQVLDKLSYLLQSN